MQKKKSRIPEEIKIQIISELSNSNKSVIAVANLYNVHPTTIRGWLKQGKATESNNHEQFTELPPPNSTLQKASLTFSDFSFSIEGNFSSTKFMSILKVLEKPS